MRSVLKKLSENGEPLLRDVDELFVEEVESNDHAIIKHLESHSELGLTKEELMLIMQIRTLTETLAFASLNKKEVLELEA
jgi:hypothetical protein